MSLIEKINDVNNTFLSRRELTCNFTGLGGKLKKIEAVDMISQEFKLDGKIIIPIKLQNHVGKPTITGTFYVYEDENLAKKHINPTIFSRLEKAKSKPEPKEAEGEQKEPESTESSEKTEESKSDVKEKPDSTEETNQTKAKEKPAKEKNKSKVKSE